jgi:hypothetical protein
MKPLSWIWILAIAAAAEPPLPVYYDSTSPPLAFAAGEIARSRPGGAVEFPLERYDPARCAPCVVLVSGPAPAAAWAARLKVKLPARPDEQAYSIRRAGQTLAVFGGSAAGAMYGGLDVAEALRIGAFATLANSDHTPHIGRRGIKFNIPLDARTPSYSDNSDAAQGNIAEMWSFDFWREFLDEMARHRYNTLSLWNLHPFPSLVKIPEFPEVALEDVKKTTIPLDETYTFTGSDMVRPQILANLQTVKRMTIDDKIRFWRAVMDYAHGRGIEVYWITWNLFAFGAEGKHGITKDQTNETTIAYFRAAMREMVLTYPRLAGFGITAGEQMQELSGEHAKERWLWRTYGEGVRDALKLQPGRQFRMIHRYHQTGQDEILREFKDYPGPFDLSFKYSVAHMYSIPNPPFIKPVLANLPAGRKMWLTVRNDDIYSFRWGDPAYARDYIRNIPGPDKIAGFYMGPDGYNWGREFLSNDPETPRQLVISKQWYSFLLWGRLSYEPGLSDEQFTKTLAARFPGVPAGVLRNAWSSASQVFPLITRFFWGDIDLRWQPEACISHPRSKGWYTVKHFVEGATMPGSGVLNVLDWRRRKLAGGAMQGVTPLEIAQQLESAARAALGQVEALQPRAGGDKELRLTLGDMTAMSRLGMYYAAKIRAAASLGLYDRTRAEPDRQAAVAELEKALEEWKLYARAYTAQYVQPRLYNRVGWVDIPKLTEKVAADIDIARAWQPGTYPDERPRARDADQPFRK